MLRTTPTTVSHRGSASNSQGTAVRRYAGRTRPTGNAGVHRTRDRRRPNGATAGHQRWHQTGNHADARSGTWPPSVLKTFEARVRAGTLAPRDSVEILSLRDALYQSCNQPVDVSRILQAAYQPLRLGEHAKREPVRAKPQARVRASIEHLSSVLNSRISDCACLAGFLELTAKEAVLEGQLDSVNESILWGWRVCEEFHRTHAESRVAPPH